jgi:hypothetical protein
MPAVFVWRPCATRSRWRCSAASRSTAWATLSWFADALEQLGDFGIETVDAGHDLDKQIDDVMAKLDAHPDHEGLHHTLVALCERASKGFERRRDADFDPLEAELAQDMDDESE